jgi:branched-chain amino acid transport system permease protein
MKLPVLGPTATLLGIVLLGFGVLVPLLPLYLQSLAINLLIFAGLAYSINLITGLTGYVSFGHVVFMGVGAYSFGYAVSVTKLHPLVGVALGGAIGLVLALGIGAVTLRFRGAYFGIATLVSVLAAFYIVHATSELGGGQGLRWNIGFEPLAWFYTIWSIVIAEIALTLWITRSRVGYGIRAIKSDEDAAKAIGIDTARLKIYIYALSGSFAGATGAVFAWSTSGAFPDQNFSLQFSLQMLAMIVIGGMGTVIGPIIGAVTVFIPSHYLQTVAVGAHLIFIGLLVAVFALFLPGGIVAVLRKYVPEIGRWLE